MIGGVCAVIAVAALAFFCLFAILHVAMQIQRREICVTFSWAVFLKVAMAAIAGTEDFQLSEYASSRLNKGCPWTVN